MSLIPKCSVCDQPVENPYAPATHCARCSQPCDVCRGPVQNCAHPLPERADLTPPYSRVSFDIDPQSKRDRFAA